MKKFVSECSLAESVQLGFKSFTFLWFFSLSACVLLDFKF